MTTFKSISVAVLLVLAMTTLVTAKANSVATVQNNTTYSLGTVAVYASNGPNYVYVGAQGTFYVNVPSLPGSVVVNNQVVIQGQSGMVRLLNGATVKVTLSGYIVVTDSQEGF
ncbi:MAG: hypothetical protein Q8916_07945 [Bacteroidota bacterium]|nr:hypothetical protein [Bacteroidota bacterium]MDP4230317.1 hypothetical protein [Bacteroidota bacterium]MDP4237764.1 hypothetical protein [Bacteroidota bacterium]